MLTRLFVIKKLVFSLLTHRTVVNLWLQLQHFPVQWIVIVFITVQVQSLCVCAYECVLINIYIFMCIFLCFCVNVLCVSLSVCVCVVFEQHLQEGRKAQQYLDHCWKQMDNVSVEGERGGGKEKMKCLV